MRIRICGLTALWSLVTDIIIIDIIIDINVIDIIIVVIVIRS